MASAVGRAVCAFVATLAILLVYPQLDPVHCLMRSTCKNSSALALPFMVIIGMLRALRAGCLLSNRAAIVKGPRIP